MAVAVHMMVTLGLQFKLRTGTGPGAGAMGGVGDRSEDEGKRTSDGGGTDTAEADEPTDD